MLRSSNKLRSLSSLCKNLTNLNSRKTTNNKCLQHHGSMPHLYSSQRCLSLSFQRKYQIQSYTNHNNIKNNRNNKSNSLFSLSKHSFSNLPDHEVVGLPALSPSVEQSKIVEWKKKEGDFVEANEAIAIVQTDKAELDWQLTDDVYLAKILLEPGETVPVGTPACIFVESAGDVASFANYTTSPGAAAAASSGGDPSPSQPTQPAQSTGSGLPSNLPAYTIEGMPALSPTATDGAIVEWSVKEGDMVEEGSAIGEIQTDKSVVRWDATDEAYVAKLLYPASPDTKLPVGGPVAVFVESKEDVAAFANIDVSAFLQSGDSASQSSAPPATQEVAPTPTQQAPAAASSSTQSNAQSNERVMASPYARKVARELNVDLTLIGNGSGTRGRITASDVEAAAKEQKTKPAASKAGASATKSSAAPSPISFELPSSDRTFEDIPMSMMREVIAKRLSESKFTSPHYYITFEFEIDNLMKMRADMNEGEDSKVSINDFIVKASALALKQVPLANVSWHDTYLRRYNYVDISVAVATPTGLITPIVKDADLKGLRTISYEVKDLATRAKDNKLLPQEFQGGTFTISNLGMFGVKQFTAIINPPQSCILAVGGGSQMLKPDATSAKGFKTVTTMMATISSDHRSVDGALAAQYMGSLKNYIEHPSKMLL